MISISPIIKKEIEVRSRRKTFTAALACLVALLFLVSIWACLNAIRAMNSAYEPMYALMLRVYDLMATAVLVLTELIAPLFTVSAICGEKEAGTLDILLTTRLSPLNIVLEKFLSAFLSVMVMLWSCLPPLLVPLMFGGAGVSDAVRLLLSYIPGVYLVMSIGLFMSAAQRSALRSFALTYAVLIAMALSGIFMTRSGYAYLSPAVLIADLIVGSALIYLSSRFVMKG